MRRSTILRFSVFIHWTKKPTFYTMTSIQHDYTDESTSTNRIVPNSLIPTRKSFLNKQWEINTFRYAYLFDKDTWHKGHDAHWVGTPYTSCSERDWVGSSSPEENQ